MQEGIGQLDVVRLRAFGVELEGRENPVGDSVHVIAIEWVVTVGSKRISQVEMVNETLGHAIKGNVPEHVGFDVVDEATQALFDGLFDKGLDDVMGLTGSSPAHDLTIFME